MIAQNNPRPCLEDDDVEGLATLYPDCSGQSLSVAVCHKVNHNIGIVRVSAYVLVPIIVALVVMMACAAYIADHHEAEAEEMREELQQLKLKMKKGQLSKELRDVRKDRRASGGGTQQQYSRARATTVPAEPAESSSALHPATYVRPTHRAGSSSSSLPHPARRPGPASDDYDVRA